MKDIKRIAYEKYKLDWMIQHGYTLTDLIELLDNYCYGVYDDFKIWQKDEGFNGDIWASYDEFIDNEHEDEEYMGSLLDVDEFDQYLEDRKTWIN